MEYLELRLTAVVLALGLWYYAYRRSVRRRPQPSVPPANPYPYFARRFLLTRAELAFFRVLYEAVGEKYYIAPKVRLAGVIRCRESDWYRGHGSRIAQKEVDFVLCDPKTSRIVLVIELDDRSHDRPKRRARDLFLEAALDVASVPLLRTRVASNYSVDSVRHAIRVATLRYR